MKDVFRYNYNKQCDDVNGKWFRVANIYCDNCGKQMTDFITLTKPDMTEEDYCSECLRKLSKERRLHG